MIHRGINQGFSGGERKKNEILQIIEKDRVEYEKIKKEKLYRYYTCDYCNEEIKITPKIDEQLGGIVILPRSLTKRDPIKLCLCNKCLNPVIAEFEEVQQ